MHYILTWIYQDSGPEYDGYKGTLVQYSLANALVAYRALKQDARYVNVQVYYNSKNITKAFDQEIA